MSGYSNSSYPIGGALYRHSEIKASSPVMEAKAYTQSERDAMAKNGEAMSDGSFPIKTTADLSNAIQAYGRAKNKSAAKAHIIKRAKAMGAVDKLPSSWGVSAELEADMLVDTGDSGWHVVEESGQYCVYTGSGRPTPGGSSSKVICYPTAARAYSKVAELYKGAANSPLSASMLEEINTAARNVIADMQGQALLVDVNDVEIIKCGIEYPLSTGPHTFTPEELVDAAEAPNNPNIGVPRIKLGHDGPLSQITSSDEPSVGTVQNLRVTPDGQTLLGDYRGVPSWLAGILASAYPSRSVEGDLNVEKNGHSYRLVITAVSLLGVVWPGCSSIADIQALYSEEGPEGVRVIEARQGGAMPPPAVKDNVKASVTAQEVRRVFYDEVAVGDRSYWWVCSQYVDPPVLIVEGSDDEYYSVGYSFDGDNVVFDDPVAVVIQYVDDSGKVAAEEAEPAAVFASRAESRSEIDKQEEYAVKLTTEQIKQLRARLGKTEEELPDNATDDQITAALAETPPEENSEGEDGEDGAGDGSSAEGGDTPDDVEEDDGEQVEAGKQLSVKAMQKQLKAAGLAIIDENTLSDLKAGAQAGLRLDKEAKLKGRDEVIAAAIQAGKFAPKRKSHWEKLWDKDPEGTKETIDGLEAGLVPVDPAVVDASSLSDDEEAYPSQWLKREAQSVVAGSNGNNGDRPRLVTVGED